MVTTRLLNPNEEQLRLAIRVALRGADFQVVAEPTLMVHHVGDQQEDRLGSGKGYLSPPSRGCLPSDRPVRKPENWADQILGSPAGVALFDGGIVTEYEYLDDDDDDEEEVEMIDWSSTETSALLAAWWTAPDSSKFVVVASCVAHFDFQFTYKKLIALPSRVKPRSVIRGYRKSRREGLVGALSRTPFEFLSRMPALDPNREALELAALYGDPGAKDALHDYKVERGLA